MKKITSLFLFLILAVCLSAQGIIFVRYNATGGNNGSSWDNAFTTIEAALGAAQSGEQIWVGAGTYVPAGTTLDNSFYLSAGIEMYGGFAGSESNLSQRNIGANPTILSGDVLGNDVDNDFSVGRADNRLHVLRVEPGTSPSAKAIIDGFTIKGGNTSVVATASDLDRRGAGIYATGKLTVRNCNFNNNRAESGAGIMVPTVGGSGLEVYNCTFEKNSVTTRGAGMYFLDLTSATIRKCAFLDNSISRGALYPRSSTNVVVDSCNFTNNVDISPTGFGGAIFSWQVGILLSNCQFTSNSSGSGAAVYLDNRERGKFAELRNCVFDNNVSTDYGGNGIFINRQNYLMQGCTFKNHVAPSSGAAIYNSDSIVFTVKDCLIENNSGQWGAAIANYGEGCDGTYENCTFKGNTAENGGGAVSDGFRANITYQTCVFEGNNGRIGGAIFTQNDTTHTRIIGCEFSENGAGESGGCVYQNTNVRMDIENSIFKINSANIGGAIYATGDSSMHISNSIFSDNLAIEQCAAVYVINGDVEMTNCLLARNLNVSLDGAGGAIGNNASDSLVSNLKLVNCTIAVNLAPIGAGVAQWEEDEAASANLTVQNCLIQNVDGANYAVEGGTPQVTSLGGNQCSDDSMVDALTATKDANSITNDFVNAPDGDYHLLAGPALDGGIAAGAPTSDLEGNPHQGAPDRGCYELGTSGIRQPELVVLPLQIAPNPAVSNTVISLNNNWLGEGVLEIIGTDGRVVSTVSVQKNSTQWAYNLSVNQMPAGTYRVHVRSSTHVFGAVLVVVQ